MSTLIRGGTVVTATSEFRADVLVDDGIIRAVSQGIDDYRADEVLDAGGSFVLPGLVDTHTHIGIPSGMTTADFGTETAAAAAGGTTTIVDFAVQTDGSLLAGLRHWQDNARRKAHIDYGFHLIFEDASPPAIAEMQQAVDQGVTSFKLFMANRRMVDDGQLLAVLRRTRQTGGLVQVHAESGEVIAANIAAELAQGHTSPKYHAVTRPPSTEGEATSRAIHLANWANRPIYFVHVSCADALDEIQRAQAAGAPVFGETCVHYLLLTQDELARPGPDAAKFTCSPPLRRESDQRALWSALRRRALQNCTTDHCPYGFRSHKHSGLEDFSKIANGLPTIEHRLSLLYEHGVRSGRLTLPELVNITATSPARMFGLAKKGQIAPGYDADITIFDPEATTAISQRSQHMAVDYTPYEGWTCRGRAAVVLSRGEIVYRNDEILGEPGRGRYLRRDVGPFPPGTIPAPHA